MGEVINIDEKRPNNSAEDKPEALSKSENQKKQSGQKIRQLTEQLRAYGNAEAED